MMEGSKYLSILIYNKDVDTVSYVYSLHLQSHRKPYYVFEIEVHEAFD